MVGAVDFICGVIVVVSPDVFRVVNDLASEEGMSFHDVEFFGSEASWLIQDRVGEHDFSDVMERADGYHDIDFVLVSQVRVPDGFPIWILQGRG